MNLKCLVIETSTEKALIAEVCLTVNSQGESISCTTSWSKKLSGGAALSKGLGTELAQLLLPPYNRIILGVGPGSYTGIRVGASMAQALSFGWSIPLFSVTSPTAFAPENSNNFYVAIDARSGGIFVQKNFERPKLLGRDEATKLLENKFVTSPHPSFFPFTPLETFPNASLMSLHAKKIEPLELIYS